MDNSPTALFDSYEQDFNHFSETIKDKLESESKDESAGTSRNMQFTLVFTVNTEQRKATLRRVEMELDEADEMVSFSA